MKEDRIITHMKQQDFEAYIRQIEPSAQESANAWKTAIGLQAVDGLKPSSYLLETAKRNIEGDITIEEVRELLDTYYRSKTVRTAQDEDTEEADKVSANIKKILSSKTLAFHVNGFISMHRRIFEGVFKHAGEIRKYDITKKEWVLKGDTVHYLNWEDIRAAIDYDIRQEQEFSYKGLSEKEKINHISRFVSGLWQIHPFREGNTRTTASGSYQPLPATIQSGVVGFGTKRSRTAGNNRTHSPVSGRKGFTFGGADVSIWPLSADFFVATRRTACQLAGNLE